MCGRYIATSTPDDIKDVFSASGHPNFPPRFNICPSDDIQVIRLRKKSNEREIISMRWGIAHDKQGVSRSEKSIINARSESINVTSFFTKDFNHRRCLVPADGFYEWEKLKNYRQPYLFRPLHDSLMAFAGIWRKNNSFPSSDSLSKYSCCILTKQATNVASEIHHRMPLILDPIHWSSWLGDKMVDKSDLMQIIKNGFYDDLYSIPVSTRVNSAANDDIHCLEQIDPFSSLGENFVLPF